MFVVALVQFFVLIGWIQVRTQNPVGVKLWQVGWELPVDNIEPEDVGGVYPSSNSTTGIVINIS